MCIFSLAETLFHAIGLMRPSCDPMRPRLVPRLPGQGPSGIMLRMLCQASTLMASMSYGTGPHIPKPCAIGSTYAALASHFQTFIKFSLVSVIISHRQWHRCHMVHTTHLKTHATRLHICSACKLM